MDTAPIPTDGQSATDDAKKAAKRDRQRVAWLKWRHSAKGDEYFAKKKKPQP